MSTLFTSAAVSAIAILAASLIVTDAWTYYAPTFLTLTVVMLQLINARNAALAKGIISKHAHSLLDEEKRVLLAAPSLIIPHFVHISTFARVDGSTAGFVVTLAGVISGIAYMFCEQWILSALCLAVVAICWIRKMPAMFLSNDSQTDSDRAAWMTAGYGLHTDERERLGVVFRNLLEKLARLLKES